MEERARRGLRILIVEDEPQSREGLRLWLTARGHRVDAAGDGWQALRWIKAAHFDAAIIDLGLPPILGLALDGWDLVRILRAYAADTVLIVMTAGETRAPEALSRAIGGVTVLEKPLRLERLRRLLEDAAVTQPERAGNP